MTLSTPSPQTVAALGAALQARLRHRARQLMDEVRRYPGPIARCDEQLGALLEQRSNVYQVLDRLERASTEEWFDENAASLATLAECLSRGALGEDDAHLAVQLAALRDEWRALSGGCGPADTWTNDGGSPPCSA